jgi:hypothetical protein
MGGSMKRDKEFYLQMKEEALALKKEQEYRMEVVKKMLELAETELKKFK